MNMTKKGALSVTGALDRLATLVQQEYKTLGLTDKVAEDFAYRCDLISDRVERTAGLTRRALTELDVNKEKGFDPEVVGEEQSGPLEAIDSDEPFMKGEFTQQENRELRERIQDGDLGMSPNFEEQAPQAGKQAAEFAAIGKKAMDARLATACGKLQNAVMHLGGKGDLPKAVAKLAHAIMDVQMGIQTGLSSPAQAEQSLQAVAAVLPHLASVKDVAKVARMVALANQVVAKKSEDEGDDEGDDKEPKAEPPKKGVIPPQFQKNVDKKKEEAGDGDEDKKESGKKAHGFDLLA